MIKNFITVILASMISFGGVSLINIQPAQADSIQLYKIELNQHGLVLKTSVGLFYIGRSGDAIQEVSGRRAYGYWEEEDSVLYVYIGNNVYWFSI